MIKIKINYEYKKGILLVDLNGVVDYKNALLVSNSIRRIISLAGIEYTIINIKKTCVIEDSFIQMIINDESIKPIYLKNYTSNNYKKQIINFID